MSLRYDHHDAPIRPRVYSPPSSRSAHRLPFRRRSRRHQKKPAPAKPAAVVAQVYLTPTCGCCSKWVDHMSAAGFATERSVMNQAELDKMTPRQKVPANLRSCHTAVVGKYVIEGHVPADVVRQLLKEAPPGVVGLSAPNMPVSDRPAWKALTPSPIDHGVQGRRLVLRIRPPLTEWGQSRSAAWQDLRTMSRRLAEP